MTVADPAGLPVRLKQTRERLGITQREAALRLGITERHYQRIESGKTNVTIFRLHDMAVAFGTTTDDLLGVEAVAE